MKIGILETGRTPPELIDHYGSYAEMFITLFATIKSGLDFEIFAVMEDHFPESIDVCEGWLITGSRHGVYENLPWMLKLQDVIRAIDHAKKPLVGICFGHQIIAQALGGRVEKSAKGWGVGRHRYDLSDGFSFASGRKDLVINAMHQDQVVEKPEQATIFAFSDFCPHAGLCYEDRIITLQAHPEFNIAYERALLECRRTNVIPEDIADPAIADLRQNDIQTDSLEIAHWLTAFFQAKGPRDTGIGSSL